MVERPHAFLQENLLTVLVWDNDHGRIVWKETTPELFQGDYRTVAERAMEFWRVHGTAPKAHLADEFHDILLDPSNKKAKTFTTILMNMEATAQEINTAYVMSKLHIFNRTQQTTQAIMRSADQIGTRKELALEEVENIWRDLLRSRKVGFQPGLRLSQHDRVMDYHESHYDEFSTGIKELDQEFVVPARGEVFLFGGAPGRGKTRFLVQIGKINAALRRKKILHVSLEMAEELVGRLYYQGLWAITKRQEKSNVTRFVRGENGDLEGFEGRIIRPPFRLNSKYARLEIETRVNQMGTKLHNVMIKRFATRSLTMDDLQSYLDQLEAFEHFIPDLVILDYVGIMKTSDKERRVQIGRNFEEFRGVMVDRNMAGVTAHQINREGDRNDQANRGTIAEDFSLINSADIFACFNQTALERKYGLARLFIDKVRDQVGGWEVLLSQNYDAGIFALESIMLKSLEKKLLDEYVDAADEDEDEEEEEVD